MFGKVAAAMYSKSSEATPYRVAHIAATLSQGLRGMFSLPLLPKLPDYFFRREVEVDLCGGQVIVT
jgi:hypothetical protein